jgi:pimeloyl-ACP methyl ester carboxylesterase
MQHAKWDKANIIGLSMGGGIAASFTSMFPHLVDDHVALIASAGIMESSDISRTAKFLSSPLIQIVASSSPFRLYLRHLANKNTSIPNTLTTLNTSDPHPIQELVRIQSAHLMGYNAALASSIREGPIRGLGSHFKSLETSGRKVLLIHGTADTTVPYKYATRIQRLMPSSKLITLDSAGHDLVLSHSKEVGDALIRFFES